MHILKAFSSVHLELFQSAVSVLGFVTVFSNSWMYSLEKSLEFLGFISLDNTNINPWALQQIYAVQSVSFISRFVFVKLLCEKGVPRVK